MHYYTPEGRPILDASAALWCCNAGHNRPHIVEAIQRQAAELDFSPVFQFAHPQAFALSARLAALAPGDLDHVFFTNSGSEAVDTALKIALAYHRQRGEASRTRLIGRERGYHGVGFGGMSVGGIGNNRKSFGPLLPGVDHLPQTYNREKQAFSRGEPEWGAHLADELERLVSLHDPSTIAAVIVEPVACSAGVLVPPKGYLKRLRDISAKYGILLIFDEVITGFGRLGTNFAADYFDVLPDLVTAAKGLTSGAAPMGAVIARKRLVRPRVGRKIAGVCLGVAEYFDLDVTLVRVVWLIVALMPPTVGLLAYLIAWIVMPEEPEMQTAPVGHQVTNT
jgi:beta-alanine--pyruvate transaminase